MNETDTASATAPAWRSARRLLAVRLDNLGDVLMTTPALRALRQSEPGRRLSLLAGGAGAALAPYLPEVDEVITATCPWMPGSAPGPNELQATVERLRAGRFDAAVIFTVYSQSALPAAMLCWLAGIPLRLAYSRENPYHLLTDHVVDPEPHELLRHEVRRQLDLVARVGATTDDTRMSFHVDARDRAAAAVLLGEAGVDAERPYAVIHPGASAASRRYPPLRIPTWHVHGDYLYYLGQLPHTFDRVRTAVIGSRHRGTGTDLPPRLSTTSCRAPI